MSVQHNAAQCDSSLPEPSLRLSCVYIFIPWPSLGDLAPPVSSRCPTWRSRGADLSLFFSLFPWFQRRFSSKVSFCVCRVSVMQNYTFHSWSPKGEVVVRLRAGCAQASLQIRAWLSTALILPGLHVDSEIVLRLLGCLSREFGADRKSVFLSLTVKGCRGPL